MDESEPQAAFGLEGRSHSEVRWHFGCEVVAAVGESGSSFACEDEAAAAAAAAGFDFDFVGATV